MAAKRRQRTADGRRPEVLDAQGAAGILTVSTDTVYGLFRRGDLPGRKVGRKWLTTRSALLRWIEGSAEEQRVARAIERGDHAALRTALRTGTARVKGA